MHLSTIQNIMKYFSTHTWYWSCLAILLNMLTFDVRLSSKLYTIPWLYHYRGVVWILTYQGWILRFWNNFLIMYISQLCILEKIKTFEHQKPKFLSLSMGKLPNKGWQSAPAPKWLLFYSHSVLTSEAHNYDICLCTITGFINTKQAIWGRYKTSYWAASKIQNPFLQWSYI